MFEQRNHIRYKSLAKVRILDANIGEALLSDLSITGCRVECTGCAGLELNKQYKMEIMPESDANIDAFELLVESLWVSREDYSCEIGFNVSGSPKGKPFWRYVDYLSWRYFHGSSMTGSGAPESPSEE